MSRLFVAFLIFAVYPLSVQAQHAPPTVTATMPKHAYTLLLGEKITFELWENMGTGYAWVVAENNEEVTVLVEKEHGKIGTPGASGMLRLTFEAKGSGTSKIVLELRRPWEKASCPAERFYTYIHVK